jgi:cytochrome b6-f complex iron-sulfur subunit
MWFSLGGGALIAKDALGDDVTVKGWLDAHPAGDRKLVQGMKGDATYLIVKEDKTLEVLINCIPGSKFQVSLEVLITVEPY